MKRKNLVRIHLMATMIATFTIGTFLTSSLIAEVKGAEEDIKMVKAGIFFMLPLLFLIMPALAITGNKLAGHSKHPMIVQKQRRMKLVMINGMLLIILAVFLYYRSNYQTLDRLFFYAQITEFVLGLSNLTLIGLNLKAGLQLSGRSKKDHERNTHHKLLNSTGYAP